MAGQSSVPRPLFGPTGFQVPDEADVLDGVWTDINAAFGNKLRPDLRTPQGQLASSLTAIIGDKNNAFLYYTNLVDPAYTEGRMQDGIARIYFIERNPALPTVVQATCSGKTGVLILAGSQAAAADGTIYAATQSATIGISGSVVVEFAAVTTGPIACGPNTLTRIYRSVSGWDAINNLTAGVPGRDVESPSDFEARRTASVGLNAVGSLASVRGQILTTPGVLDAYVTENKTSASVVIGGVTLPPHSLYVSVIGGDPNAIAKAIWTKKGVGCDTKGSTTIQVYDDAYTDPKPSYPISFDVATPARVCFSVGITDTASIPSDAKAQIGNALLQAFTGADGGPRARIGQTIYATRFIDAVRNLGDWGRTLVYLQVGQTPSTANLNSLLFPINFAPVFAAADVTLTVI